MINWRQRLREKLRESGKTKHQVAVEAGVNPAFLTQILEKKEATPRIDNLAKIASVLDTSVSYLVDGVDLNVPAARVVGIYCALSDGDRKVALATLEGLAAGGQGKTL